MLAFFQEICYCKVPNFGKEVIKIMNKTELVAAVAQKTGLTKKDAERVVNATVDTVVESMKKGEKVQLSGFGIFEVKTREARVGRNPRTKETIQIPASRQPIFKASKTLKDAIAK